MAKRPNPPKGPEQVRNLGCSFYAECIGIAASNGWRGLDCAQCPQHTGPEIETLKLSEGPDTIKARPRSLPRWKPKTPEEIAQSADLGALAVLAAMVRAENQAKGPASSRQVGAFLGLSGGGALLLLADLEARGYVRRVPCKNGQADKWSLK